MGLTTKISGVWQWLQCRFGYHDWGLVGPIPGFHWNLVAVRCKQCRVPGMSILDEDSASVMRTKEQQLSLEIAALEQERDHWRAKAECK